MSDKTGKTVKAQVPGATDADLTSITLAHPLTRPEDFTMLGIPLDEAPLAAGTKVQVRREHALSLIGAGYAQDVDPDNPASVAKALGHGESAESELGAGEQRYASVAGGARAAMIAQGAGEGVDVAPAGSAETAAPGTGDPATKSAAKAADKAARQS